MPRYKLTIAYDGTHFCGWQKQEPFLDAVRLPKDQREASDPSTNPTTKSSRDQFVIGEGDVALRRNNKDATSHPRDTANSDFATDSTTDQKNLIVEELPIREGESRPRVAMRTVQHVVERAVRAIVRENIILDGASRTDSGVHAKGQVAAFTCTGEAANERNDEHPVPPTTALRSLWTDTRATPSSQPGNIPTHTGWPLSRGTDRLIRAINARLPADVLVTHAQVVSDTFNPITDCTSKAYSYSIHTGPIRPLFDRNLVHCVYDPLNIAAMQAAAKHLVGEHDFVSFAALHHGRASTVRTVFSCDVTSNESPNRVRIDITGNGFLYNMVRIIAGTLVEVGRGRMSPDAIPEILAKKDRRAAGPTLPGSGLCLEWIRYSK